jgi:hypothetical protein
MVSVRLPLRTPPPPSAVVVITKRRAPGPPFGVPGAAGKREKGIRARSAPPKGAFASLSAYSLQIGHFSGCAGVSASVGLRHPSVAVNLTARALFWIPGAQRWVRRAPFAPARGRCLRGRPCRPLRTPSHAVRKGEPVDVAPPKERWRAPQPFPCEPAISEGGAGGPSGHNLPPRLVAVNLRRGPRGVPGAAVESMEVRPTSNPREGVAFGLNSGLARHAEAVRSAGTDGVQRPLRRAIHAPLQAARLTVATAQRCPLARAGRILEGCLHTREQVPRYAPGIRTKDLAEHKLEDPLLQSRRSLGISHH